MSAAANETLISALTKAYALSLMTYGEAGEEFRCLAGDLQGEYMWALSDLLGEALAALEIINGQGGAA